MIKLTKNFILFFVFCCFSVYADLSDLKYVATAAEFNALPVIAFDAYEYLRITQKTEGVSRFIFMRHGESTSNAEKSMAGRTLDVDLSANGKEQVRIARQHLLDTGIPIDAVYSSPSLRALTTAEILLHPPKLVTDERLYEKFYGPYEGSSELAYKPIKKIEEVDNSGPTKNFIEKFSFKAHPDMESMADVYCRTISFLQEKHPFHQGNNVVVTTHNAVLKALFMAASASQGFDVDYRSFDLGNAAIIVVEVNDGEAHVLAANGLKFRESK